MSTGTLLIYTDFFPFITLKRISTKSYQPVPLAKLLRPALLM